MAQSTLPTRPTSLTRLPPSECVGCDVLFYHQRTANAGEPLQRVTITQREGADDIRRPRRHPRILGTRNRKGERLILGKWLGSARKDSFRDVWPAGDSGQTVTIGLRPVRIWGFPAFTYLASRRIRWVRNPTVNFLALDDFTSTAVVVDRLASCKKPHPWRDGA